MFSAILKNRSLIALSGADSINFLQGLISNDARFLEKGQVIYAALLSPQGKFQHDFFLIPHDGKIYMDVAAARAADLLQKLKIYKLRSAVEIDLVSELKVAAMWGGEASTSDRIYVDPRLAEMGYRALVTDENLGEDDYENHRLSLGVPDTADMIEGRSLLLECGFEELHGVDFNKGCYVGQEVTARSKFRGQVRKNFYMVRGQADLPDAGTSITAGDKIMGEMRTSQNGQGMAIINNDEYEKARVNNIDFLCSGNNIELIKPGWIKNSN